MKTFFIRNWKYAAWALFMLGVFAGCSTQRHTPNPRPRFVTDYREQAIYEKLKRLPVRLELSGFDEKLPSVDSESPIGTTAYELLPFKPIVKREFEEFIDTNFRLVGNDVKANLVLKVVPENYPVKRNSADDIECAMSFKVSFKAATDEPGKPLFTQIHELFCHAAVDYHDIEGLVPCSIYAAVQKAVKNCIKQIAGDANLMEKLRRLLVPHGPVIYGKSFEMPAGKDSYYYKEDAHGACNDDEPVEVQNWAMQEIRNRWSHTRLFNTSCMFFSRAEFIPDERVWMFNYDIIERNEFIVIPDRTTGGYTGRCFLDCTVVTNDVKRAEVYMKNRLSDWFLDEKDHRPSKVELLNFHKDENNSGFHIAEYKCR